MSTDQTRDAAAECSVHTRVERTERKRDIVDTKYDAIVNSFAPTNNTTNNHKHENNNTHTHTHKKHNNTTTEKNNNNNTFEATKSSVVHLCVLRLQQ